MKHRICASQLGSSVFIAVALSFLTVGARAQTLKAPALTVLPQSYGPYSGHFLTGGIGLTKPLPAADPILTPGAPWTLSAWVEFSQLPTESILIAGAGDPLDEDSRFLAFADGKPTLRFGQGHLIRSKVPLNGLGWHLLAATFDGNTARLYVDGAEVGHGPIQAGPIKPELILAPIESSCIKSFCAHFGGRIALFSLSREALSPQDIAALAAQKPDFQLIAFEEGSKPWALQVVQFAGNTAPQDPATLPHRNAPFSEPKAEPLPPSQSKLKSSGEGDWVIAGGWKLAAAPKVSAPASVISEPGFSTGNWLAATVPGTVLTTMIARGIYPDPDYGLNNLDIPENLNKQDYWYRAEFASPSTRGDSHVSLVLDGINYRAEVWLNGQHLGSMTGAFIRGVFDVSKVLHADGKNALAILVSPAPHPGIPNV